ESLPDALIEIVEKAMHKDPGERFQSASEFLQAIKSLDAWSERALAFETVASRLRIKDISAALSDATQLSPESPVAGKGAVKAGTAARSRSDFIETVLDGGSLAPRQSGIRTASPWVLWIAV